MPYRISPLCRSAARVILAGFVSMALAMPASALAGQRSAKSGGHHGGGARISAGIQAPAPGVKVRRMGVGSKYVHRHGGYRHFGGYRNFRTGSVPVDAGARRSGVVLRGPAPSVSQRHSWHGSRYKSLESAPGVRVWRGGVLSMEQAGRGIAKHHGHDGSRNVVVIADGYAGGGHAGGVEPGSPTEPVLQGDCAPGQYCVLRLGDAWNAPKIITLNESGQLLRK